MCARWRLKLWDSEMLIIGLTGSIGMGKSTTAAMFRDAGVPVYDADAAVADLYQLGGAAVAPLEAAFPGVTKDGAVDREALRTRVLARPGMTADRLDAILARQMHDSEKRARAHFVVDTGRGLEPAREQVTEIIATMRDPQRRPPRRLASLDGQAK